MKKKIVVTLLSLTMAVGLLAGCGSTTGESSQSKGSSENNQGTVELDFWFSGGKTAVNVLQDTVDEFNKSQTKYHINTVTQADYDETYEKLQAGIAGNKAPDVALLDVDKARNLSEKDLVADIQPYVDADSNFDKDDYLQVFWNQGYDTNGKLFAFPAYGTTQIMYYNIKAFKDAGINADDIKTWQDLESAATKIHENNPDMAGWEPMWGKGNMIDAALGNGGKVLSDDGKTVTINSKEWVEVWESFRKWIHDDKIMKIHSGGQGWEYWYKTIDDVLADKAGGYTGSSGDQADLDFTKVAADGLSVDPGRTCQDASPQSVRRYSGAPGQRSGRPADGTVRNSGNRSGDRGPLSVRTDGRFGSRRAGDHRENRHRRHFADPGGSQEF